MTKLYDAGNPNCSPYEPAMGHTVIYRTNRQGRSAVERFPAIITKKYENDSHDRVDLVVFTSTGPRHDYRVPYSSEEDSERTWCWLPELVEREPFVQPKAEVAPQKPEKAPQSVRGKSAPVA